MRLRRQAPGAYNKDCGHGSFRTRCRYKQNKNSRLLFCPEKIYKIGKKEDSLTEGRDDLESSMTGAETPTSGRVPDQSY